MASVNQRLQKARLKSKTPKNPVYGNRDENKEYAFDEKEQHLYIVKMTPFERIRRGTTTQLVKFAPRFQKFEQEVYEDMEARGKFEKDNNIYIFEVIHDPTEGPAVSAGKPKPSKKKKPAPAQKPKTEDKKEPAPDAPADTKEKAPAPEPADTKDEFDGLDEF